MDPGARRWRWAVLGASLLGSTLAAQPAGPQESEEPPPSRSGSVGAGDTGATLEFLEFLGEWETAAGDWMDPSELESDVWPAALLDEDATDAR